MYFLFQTLCAQPMFEFAIAEKWHSIMFEK
jgi:hypothetical protein